MSKQLSTTKIDFAAFLLMNGVRLVSVEPKDSRIVRFVFECQSEDQAWAFANMYNGGACLVPVQPFAEAITRVKEMIRKAKIETARV